MTWSMILGITIFVFIVGCAIAGKLGYLNKNSRMTATLEVEAEEEKEKAKDHNEPGTKKEEKPHGAHSPPAHHEPGKKGVMDRIWEFLGLIFAIIVIFTAGSCSFKVYRLATETTQPTTASAPAEVRSGLTNKLFSFADYPDGCLTITFTSYFKAFPKGGKMRIHLPDGRQFIDEPGVDLRLGDLPMGEYRFCGNKNDKDLGATGVEILNNFHH